MPFDFDAAVSVPFRMQPEMRKIAPGTPQLTPNAAPERTHTPIGPTPRRGPDDVDGDALAARAWWRTEHQTFIPIDGHAQAVFTTHVEVHPLREALAEPARAARLHHALGSMSDAVLADRGLTPVRDRLLRWLAARAPR